MDPKSPSQIQRGNHLGRRPGERGRKGESRPGNKVVGARQEERGERKKETPAVLRVTRPEQGRPGERGRRKMDQPPRKWGPGLKAKEGNLSATEPSRTLKSLGRLDASRPLPGARCRLYNGFKVRRGSPATRSSPFMRLKAGPHDESDD
ncbi:hypothetical protein KM043_014037 [Ampulex compressa]|nr:hypothetical protein KM043_014037 [Ampulex compressa]